LSDQLFSRGTIIPARLISDANDVERLNLINIYLRQELEKVKIDLEKKDEECSLAAGLFLYFVELLSFCSRHFRNRPDAYGSSRRLRKPVGFIIVYDSHHHISAQ
jgi:hypothetical protein